VVGRASPSFAISQALLSAAISVLLVLTATPEWLDLITRNRQGRGLNASARATQRQGMHSIELERDRYIVSWPRAAAVQSNRLKRMPGVS